MSKRKIRQSTSVQIRIDGENLFPEVPARDWDLRVLDWTHFARCWVRPDAPHAWDELERLAWLAEFVREIGGAK